LLSGPSQYLAHILTVLIVPHFHYQQFDKICTFSGLRLQADFALDAQTARQELPSYAIYLVNPNKQDCRKLQKFMKRKIMQAVTKGSKSEALLKIYFIIMRTN
jgi:hypothetical protein